MEDVQARYDDRNIPIDQAGVCDIAFPIIVLDRSHREQRTVARISMSVSLPHYFKGAHMSRFIEVLNEHRGQMTLHTLPALLNHLQARLNATGARIEIHFPYFLERLAPATGKSALMDYDCTFVGETKNRRTSFMVTVRVPVTALCPCSKAISDYGAHNQRGIVEISIETIESENGEPVFVWIEDLVKVAEDSASAPVYPLLKRIDERHVTMQAYDNPVFVEDVVRNVALKLQGDNRIARFRVHVVNHESIHNHGAFASLAWKRPNAMNTRVETNGHFHAQGNRSSD